MKSEKLEFVRGSRKRGLLPGSSLLTSAIAERRDRPQSVQGSEGPKVRRVQLASRVAVHIVHQRTCRLIVFESQQMTDFMNSGNYGVVVGKNRIYRWFDSDPSLEILPVWKLRPGDSRAAI